MKLTLTNEFIITIVLGGLLAAIISVFGTEPPVLIIILRLLLALVFLFFLPGYYIHTALLPHNGDLTNTERVIISIGISIAVIPPIALLLDVTSGLDLSIWPIMMAESILIAVAGVTSWYRRSQLTITDRYLMSIKLDVGDELGNLSVSSRILYGLVAIAIVVAFASAVAIFISQSPSEPLTEFYLLNPEMEASAFPSRLTQDDEIALVIGITNQEGTPQTYYLEVRSEGTLITETDAFTLDDGENSEQNVNFPPPGIGEDIPLEFLLYRFTDDAPYRTLRLIIDVAES